MPNPRRTTRLRRVSGGGGAITHIWSADAEAASSLAISTAGREPGDFILGFTYRSDSTLAEGGIPTWATSRTALLGDQSDGAPFLTMWSAVDEAGTIDSTGTLANASNLAAFVLRGVDPASSFHLVSCTRRVTSDTNFVWPSLALTGPAFILGAHFDRGDTNTPLRAGLVETFARTTGYHRHRGGHSDAMVTSWAGDTQSRDMSGTEGHARLIQVALNAA